MAVVSMKNLFEAGAHLGHKTQKWHPKMKEYIFGAQSGIYIIDLRKTLEKLKTAYEYILNLSANGGKILFVGTKFQARDIVEEQALRSNNFFVNFRWLGGMLTNFSTIKQSITKLKRLEDIAGVDNDYVGVLKKEAVGMEKERRKLENVLGGITELRKKPAAVFIVDIKKEFIALNEAKKLGIPIVAIADTNCDPRDIDHIIPGNDDSIHCIRLFSSIIASASIEGRKIYESKIREMKQEKDQQKEAEKAKVVKSKPKSKPKPKTKTKAKIDTPVAPKKTKLEAEGDTIKETPKVETTVEETPKVEATPEETPKVEATPEETSEVESMVEESSANESAAKEDSDSETSE